MEVAIIGQIGIRLRGNEIERSALETMLSMSDALDRDIGIDSARKSMRNHLKYFLMGYRYKNRCFRISTKEGKEFILKLVNFCGSHNSYHFSSNCGNYTMGARSLSISFFSNNFPIYHRIK